MIREVIQPRENWQYRLERLGFGYHSVDGCYWQETAAYRFSEDEIDVLEEASQTLHQMCMETVADVIKNGDYSRLGISVFAAELIENSWRLQQPTLYGRFDLVYGDKKTPPKLLEYNADTPTTLFESSVIQWYWLQDNFPQADQFNAIHEHLMAQWQVIVNKAQKAGRTIEHLTFTTITDSIEDSINCRYLQDTAAQAGLNTHFMDLRELGWQQEAETERYFIDEGQNNIDYLFKLYPWEWLLTESFAKHLPHTKTEWLEPIWKLLLSNKGILALLWERYPNYPYLLPAYFEKDKDKILRHSLPYGVVKKPIFSREGANIHFLDKNLQPTAHFTDGEYDKNNGGWIYQAIQPLPKFYKGNQPVYAVIGSWIIGHLAAGIGIREDNSLITKDSSHFVPHYFVV